MFQRENFEISFENLRLNETYQETNVNSKHRKVLSNISNDNQNVQESSTNFVKLLQAYKENFIIISQKDKAAYLQLTLSDIISFFSIPVCTKQDGITKCKYNCDCSKSLDIGMQIYDKGGVQNFHQFGNYIIGCVIEQQTDPLSRVTIEFEKSSMKNIKRIFCPCNFMYCPHAFAVLYFRLKIQSFYAIRLPQQLFDGSLEQSELIKFYAHLVEESRSLPLMCDYHPKEWSLEHFKQYADVNSSMMYAYCHKSLLPIPFNIIEEQSRARKWISDLHSKRSLSCSTFQQANSNNNNSLASSSSEYSFAKMKHHHHGQHEHQMSHNKQGAYKNHSNHMNQHTNASNGYIYKPHAAKNRSHLKSANHHS